MKLIYSKPQIIADIFALNAPFRNGWKDLFIGIFTPLFSSRSVARTFCISGACSFPVHLHRLRADIFVNLFRPFETDPTIPGQSVHTCRADLLNEMKKYSIFVQNNFNITNNRFLTGAGTPRRALTKSGSGNLVSLDFLTLEGEKL